MNSKGLKKSEQLLVYQLENDPIKGSKELTQAHWGSKGLTVAHRGSKRDPQLVYKKQKKTSCIPLEHNPIINSQLH